jgi:hypothetical protein
MASLTATIQESIEFKREQEWRKAGATECDITTSRLTGMDARDIRVFRQFSETGYLFIIRCPKVAARAMHGLFPPKPLAVKQKTGSSGVVVTERGAMQVSDYDLMSVWKTSGAGAWEKIFMSAANGAPRGPWTAEARDLVRNLNTRLVSRLQHGCQDDFHSAKNPGIKSSDHFALFERGACQPIASAEYCARAYAARGMAWVYSANGLYNGPVDAGSS